MDSAYKRLEVTAGCDMDSWSSSFDSVAMPVSSLKVSFEGFKPVDNTSLWPKAEVKYPTRGEVKLSV